MPLYPYRCTQCGHRFEKIQHFDSEPETKCPKCGGALERLLTAPGLQFKGAGWYVNDYAAKSSTSSEPASSSPESKTPGESKTPAADKPAAPTPAASAASSGESKS